MERACRPLRLFRGGAAIEAQGCRGSQSEPKRRSLPFCCLCATLKLLQRLADNSLVQRSTILAALSLSLAAVTLAGVGEWASGGFDPSSSDGDGSAYLATADYAGGRVGGVPPNAPANQPRVTDAAEYTIRHNVNEVRLQFTVADEAGKPVQNLSPADIRVLDDQSQVERFQDFARDDNLPLRLGVLLDASDSVKRVLPEEKETALSFLQQILRPQSDRAFIMAFGSQAKIWQQTPNSTAQLATSVERLTEPAWGTNLYDALYDACSERLWQHHESDLVHRAIVLISDGEDTQSYRSLADVIAIAQRSETQIYALTLRPKKKTGAGDGIMRRLAEATGGRFFLASSSQEMQGAFADIEQEMRSQYFVTFQPQQSKPGFHQLRVELRAPQRFQVHARQGYFAAEN